MLLAPLVLVAALGQASGPSQAPAPAPAPNGCPAPLSRYGPPPCAASNVPGCIPGYRRTVDAWGRTTYVCDPEYAYEQQQQPPPAEPQVQAPPPPPQPPPAPAPRYAPRYAPPPPPSRGWGGERGQVGVVFMPGGVGRLGDYYGTDDGALSFALELRAPWGGERLRFGFETSSYARLVDVGLKYDFNDHGVVKPFLAFSLGGASIPEDPAVLPYSGFAFTGSISGGLDLYLTRDFFFTLELKQRGFLANEDAALTGTSGHATLGQTSFFVGLGVYF